MEIKDKWVVHEIRDNLYFTGMNPENYPVLESLNSRVRQYKSKRSAECAVRRIEESGIECCEFVAEYIKLEEIPNVSDDTAPGETCDLYDELHKLCDKYNVSFGNESQGLGAELANLARKYRKNIPDVPADKPVPSVPPDEQKEPPIIKNDGGWEAVDSFGKKGQVQYLRKREALRYIFAVQCEDGELRGFGFDEKRAWTWYSNYRRDIGVRRIEERPGKQQITEWRNAEK